MKLQPFTIQIPQADLDNLQKRLARTRWTDEVEGTGWDYGTNLGYLKELVDYWQNKFDWRAQETKLNQFTQFRTKVDGVNIHFIHERGRGPNPIPLILTHGWPDSFYRFYKVIPMLTDPVRYGGNPNTSFDVIVPSIPGFGFSDRTAMPAGAVADLWAKLMTEALGYRSFGAAGGDLGTEVTKSLAAKYPDLVTGIHLTDVGFPTGMEDVATLSPAEQEFAAFCQQWWYSEGAYNMLHSTKPQTLAYSLTDSPVGLAAWMVEKFYAWSDCEGDVEKLFTKDELLTNIMLYWVRGPSVRSVSYREEWVSPSLQPGQPVDVPVAVANPPKDIYPFPPREFAERHLKKLRRWTVLPHGGHFAAWEYPKPMAQDIWVFFHDLKAKN